MAPDDWLWNAQLQSGLWNVEAYGNVIVVNSENNGNGIMLIQQNRSTEPCLYGPCIVINDWIHDNYIIVTGSRWHGTSGAVQDYSGESDMFASSSNNRFNGNHFYVTDTVSAAYWQWGGTYRTFESLSSVGQETTGTVDLN